MSEKSKIDHWWNKFERSFWGYLLFFLIVLGIVDFMDYFKSDFETFKEYAKELPTIDFVSNKLIALAIFLCHIARNIHRHIDEK